MSEWIKNLFVTIFGENSWLATMIISMIPIVELRGAIPFGSATALWGKNALPVWKSFLFSVLGSTLVCVILTFLFWPIFKWLKKTKLFKKLAEAIERKIKKSSKNIDKKVQSESNERKTWWIKWWGVFAFVSIPLPLTGVWTGTCIALFIGLSKKDTMSSVILGNLVAGTIMTIISYFFADNTMIVLLVFLGLVALVLLYFAIRSIVSKIIKKNKKTNEVYLTENIQVEDIETNVEVKENDSFNEESIEEDIGSNDDQVSEKGEDVIEEIEVEKTEIEKKEESLV